MKLICLGDSLTFGFGVRQSERWTSLLEADTGWEVINLGINGDTTDGMLKRLHVDVISRMAPGPTHVFVMGGSNDIGMSASDERARKNIAAIAKTLISEGARPIIGIPMLPDLSRFPMIPRSFLDCIIGYAKWLMEFSLESGLKYIDFGADFLTPQGEARSELYMDGVHPSAEGHRIMADRAKLDIGLTLL